MNNSGDTTVHEFKCQRCQTLLRIPGERAGESIQCPNCNTVQKMTTPASASPMSVLDSPDTNTELEPLIPMGEISSVSARPADNAQVDSTGAFSSTDSPSSPVSATTSSGSMTPTRQLYDRICSEISKVFVGQDELVLGALVALFSGGHVLIESVPGLGKTLFVRTLGKILGCDFGRIQFTADLMPTDITGAPIFNMKTQEFKFRRGPVFTQMLLADEINRSPAKTHAALLEIMQEKTVTIDGETHDLELPFLVVATQNPIESEGTYNLPEAQLDRFMFKLIVEYPSAEQEAKILQMHGQQINLNQVLAQEIETLTNPEEILAIGKSTGDVRIDPLLVDYINRIVRLTREWPQFYMGASPRAGIAMMQGARTLAALQGRDFAVPDDVVELALPILRHRVQLTAEAEVEGQTVDQLLRDLIRTVEVPRLK